MNTCCNINEIVSIDVVVAFATTVCQLLSNKSSSKGCKAHCEKLHFTADSVWMIPEDNVVEAHGYGFRSTVVSGEHSRSKTSAIIAMYDVSTTRVFVKYLTKTLVVEMSYIAIIALVLLRECSPLTTVDTRRCLCILYMSTLYRLPCPLIVMRYSLSALTGHWIQQRMHKHIIPVVW